MSISGISNYPSYYTSAAANKTAKNENTADSGSTNTGAAQTNAAAYDKSVSSMESKTKTAAEYTKYLQEKFNYLNKSTSMEGVPTTVSVSSAFIRKCANDPEKAKYLEENLAVMPESVAHSVAVCPGTITSVSFWVDADGNISSAMSGSSDPDGKIAKENAERKARESKEKAEKQEEKRAEEKAAERAREKELEKKALVISLQEQLTEKIRTTATAGREQWSVSATSAPESQTVNSGGNFNNYV